MNDFNPDTQRSEYDHLRDQLERVERRLDLANIERRSADEVARAYIERNSELRLAVLKLADIVDRLAARFTLNTVPALLYELKNAADEARTKL